MPAILRQLAVLFLPLMPLGASAAAADPVPTGITGIGPSMFIFTIAAAVLLTLVFRVSTRHLARYVGERTGRLRIARRLRAHSKRVLNDALVPGAYGGIAKIDHAVVTAGGVLCIRSLHANGTVTGAENDAQWTLGDAGARRRCLNPLIQNEGRTRALRKALPDVKVENLVVFTGKVRFASQAPAHVITLDRLGDYVSGFLSGPAQVEDVNAVWERLNAVTLKDAETRKDFAAQISFS